MAALLQVLRGALLLTGEAVNKLDIDVDFVERVPFEKHPKIRTIALNRTPQLFSACDPNTTADYRAEAAAAASVRGCCPQQDTPGLRTRQRAAAFGVGGAWRASSYQQTQRVG